MTAIRRNQEIPTDLPPARVYLEDVEQIVELFKDAAKYDASAKYPIREKKPKVHFEVGELECDTVEDLEQMGGESSDFKIYVDQKDGYAVWLRLATYGSIWGSFALTQEGKWLVYGKLRDIFERHKIDGKQSIVELRYERRAGRQPPKEKEVVIVQQASQSTFGRRLLLAVVVAIVATLLGWLLSHLLRS